MLSHEQTTPGGSAGPSQFFVARQAILDRRRRVFAYELLYRGTEANGSPLTMDGSAATSQIAIQGILAGGLVGLTGGRRLFLNFTRDLLVGGQAWLFSPATFVIEVLEDVEPDAEVLLMCRELLGGGYQVALDDVTTVERLRRFASEVSIAKIDLLATTSEELGRIVEFARRHRIQLLAEKVETEAQMEAVVALGFDYFQGYHLGRPRVRNARMLPGFKPAHQRLLQLVAEDDLDLHAIARAVEDDPTLTYQLLRFANSAASGRVRVLTSMRDVVVLFGTEAIRRAATMAVVGALTGTADRLLVDSLVRARFCEALARQTPGQVPFHFYLTGLLSYLPELLGTSVEEALRVLPVPADVRVALAEDDGPIAPAMRLVRAYEVGDWDAVRALAAAAGVAEGVITPLYLEAVESAEVMATAA